MVKVFFTSWQIIKSYNSSLNHLRNNLFRLYFIEKDNWVGGGLMEQYLREMIDN